MSVISGRNVRPGRGIGSNEGKPTVRALPVAAIAITLALTGCGSDDDDRAASTTTTRTTNVSRAPFTPAPPVATTTTTTAVPPTTQTTPPSTERTLSPAMTDELYIGTLELQGIEVDDRDHAIALGKAVCTDFNDGLTFLQISLGVYQGYEGQFTAEEVGYMVGAAIPAYCPQHEDKLPN